MKKIRLATTLCFLIFAPAFGDEKKPQISEEKPLLSLVEASRIAEKELSSKEPSDDHFLTRVFLTKENHERFYRAYYNPIELIPQGENPPIQIRRWIRVNMDGTISHQQDEAIISRGWVMPRRRVAEPDAVVNASSTAGNSKSQLDD
jgi:hypothetical protein